VAGLPPGRESQQEHVDRSDRGGDSGLPSEEQAHADKKLNDADHVSEEDGVRQNHVGQEGAKDAHRAVTDVAIQVMLKASVGKAGAGDFVLSEEQEEWRRRHASQGNGFEERVALSGHEYGIVMQCSTATELYPPGPSLLTYCSSESS